MKKLLLLKRLFLLLVIAATAIAGASAQRQGRPERPDPKMLKEIQEYKIKFLAQEMELKDDQKERFAELYQKMSAERQGNFGRMRALEKTMRDNPSDDDYKAATEAMADVKIKDAQIEKQYDAQFAKFLTAKQIYLMKEGEEKFRHKMREMHRKHRDRRQCPPRNSQDKK